VFMRVHMALTPNPSPGGEGSKSASPLPGERGWG
jgi:hypothetical protein